MRAPGAVTPITHACEVRRRCVDFVARHECGERLQLRVFPRKIQAAEAGGWLGANAKTCDPDKNVAPLCAGRNRGSDSPGNEDGATIESVQRPHRSSSASKLQGRRSRFNVRYLPGECALCRKAMCDHGCATR